MQLRMSTQPWICSPGTHYCWVVSSIHGFPRLLTYDRRCKNRNQDRSCDRSCTWDMIHTKIHLINPHCLQPSMYLQCSILDLNTIYFIFHHKPRLSPAQYSLTMLYPSLNFTSVHFTSLTSLCFNFLQIRVIQILARTGEHV